MNTSFNEIGNEMFLIEVLELVQVFGLVLVIFVNSQHYHTGRCPYNQITNGTTSQPEIPLYSMVIRVALSVTYIQANSIISIEVKKELLTNTL